MRTRTTPGSSSKDRLFEGVMIRLKQLVRSPQVSVLRLDHEPDTEHSDAQEEVCSNYAVNFVESGAFELGLQKHRWSLSPGYVFLSEPGAVHRYSHRERKPSDICVSVICSQAFVAN